MAIFSGLTILLFFGLVGVLVWVAYGLTKHPIRPTDQVFGVTFGVFGIHLLVASVVAAVLWFQEFA